jgi:type I restriction enzyme S subunit
MNNKLPTGWIEATLGQIVEPSRERALPTEDPTLPYVSLGHIESHTMRLLGHAQASEVRSSSMRFSKGDVLYGKMRPYLNKVWVAEFDGLCSAEFLVFPESISLKNQFLGFRLNAEDFVAFAEGQVSGERPRVDFEKLSRFPLLIPPYLEQQRIVDKLTATFAAIGRAEKATLRALARLENYEAAVLWAAVTGELTRDWRDTQLKKSSAETGESLLKRLLVARRLRWEEGELQRRRAAGKAIDNQKWKSRYPEPMLPRTEKLPPLPSVWTWASLDQIGELNRGKSKHRPRDDARLYGGPYPFIQTGDIRKAGGTIRNHTQTYSEFGLKQSRLWPAGTLCITIAANIAETGILTYPACFPDSVVGFLQQNASLLEVRFVEFFIRSQKSELQRYAPATAQKNINLGILERLAIPLPPLAEQTEIVRLVDQRLSAASRLGATLQQQLVHSQESRRALLRQAFTGLLVTQNPEDSPVSLPTNRKSGHKPELRTPRRTYMAKRKPAKKIIDRRGLLDVLRATDGPMTPEELFRASGHTQDSVEQFYAELRDLTNSPAKVLENRKPEGRVELMAAP